jgi:hypothetical protein
VGWVSKLRHMRIWSFLNILSIDVALGAISGCAFFSAVLETPLRPHAYLSLGLIVWIVYTIDHLLDAARSSTEPSTQRHQFHKRHASPLTAAVVVAATLVTVEAFLVRKPVLFAGLGIAALVIVYLWLQASLKFYKEVAGAVLYTAGVVAAPWSLLGRPLHREEWIIVAVYVGTAYVNLLLFALMGSESDKRDGHPSIATQLGYVRTRKIIGTAILFIMLGIGLLIFQGSTWAAIVLLLMNAAHLIFFRWPGYFMEHERYRRLGDLVFILPAVAVLITLIA